MFLIGKVPLVVDIGIPLPLQAQFVCIELIAFLRGTDRICLSYVRFFVSQYRFATTVAILVFTDYRPVVYPFYRLQVNQTSGCTHILEVQEPVFSAWGIYPASLMRSVDRAVALCQHGFPFIRSVYVFRTQYDLPACRNTTSRMEDIIISVALVELRSFASFMCLMTVENDT